MLHRHCKSVLCSPSTSGPRSLIQVCAAGQIESNYDETVDSFDDMNLKPELLRGEQLLRASNLVWFRSRSVRLET
jgi:hypothetical protein